MTDTQNPSSTPATHTDAHQEGKKPLHPEPKPEHTAPEATGTDAK